MPNNNHGTNRFARTSFEGGEKRGDGYVEVKLEQSGIILPVSQVTTTFGLNSIPTASVIVPLGRNARNNEPSSIYKVMQSLKQMTKVTIRLKGKLGDYSPNGGPDGVKQQWPVNPEGHILFIGYVSGTSYRRSKGSVALVVNFIHKLFDLASSSAGSADLVPGSPNSLLLPAFSETAGGNKAGYGASHFTSTLKTDIENDFSTGIINVLKEMCQHKLQTHDRDTYCGGPPPDPRQDLGLTNPDTNRRALGAINPDGFDWKGLTNGGENYPLNVLKSQKQHACQSVGLTCLQSMAGTTLWSMLIGSLLPQFGLGIVPLADRAFLVPVTPSLQSDPLKCKKIYPQEYVDFAMTTMSTRPLYGVGILANYTGATLDAASLKGKTCIGASYTAEPIDGDPAAYGQWLFQDAPKWCDDWVSTDPSLGKADNVESLLTQPSHDAVGVAADAFNRDIAGESQGWNDSLERFAKQIYVANSIRDRSGRVTGKLRFDICPGSTIFIMAQQVTDSSELTDLGSSSGVTGVDRLPVSLVGLVSRVTSTINAQNASASTTFELTHLRTDVEDIEGKRFSLEKPPFFEQGFYGAPLVEALDVEELPAEVPDVLGDIDPSIGGIA